MENQPSQLAQPRTDTGVGHERRAQIVDYAASLFDAEGYWQASMEQLAEAVGIAKPTLYHYFAGKDEILFRIHQEFIVDLIRRQEDPARRSMTPLDQLRAIMRDVLYLMEHKRGHVRVFFEHWRDLSETDRDVVMKQRDHYQMLVEQVIDEGMAEGSLRSLDIRLVTLGMFGMCNWAYQWYRADRRLSSAAVADFMFELLLEGLRAR
ncbi:MAG: TetR/AcrR family transcriptional regulator [Acidimicrobiia bacterium]